MLEPVDVEEDDRQRPALALRAAQLAIERLLHVPTVEEPGERVPDGLAAQRLAEPDVRERERELLGDGHGQAHARLAEASLGDDAGGHGEGEEAERLALGRQGNADERRRRGLPEVRARRARARGVDPVDAAPAEGPAIVELEPLAPAGERRAPDRDGPQAVPRGGRHQDRPRRVREEAAAELAHHAVRFFRRGARLQELAQLPQELDLVRALGDQRVDAPREGMARFPLGGRAWR